MASSSSSSAPAATTGIYEPLLPPLHQVSDTNQGALVLLTATIFVILSGLTFAVKFYMTFVMIRKFNLHLITMIAAMVFAVGYTIAICKSVEHGLGRVADEVTGTQMKRLSQYYYASNILLYLSLASAKSSVTLLVIAFKPKAWVTMALYGVLAVVGTWVVAAVFVVAFQCGPTHWVLGPTGQNTCIDQYGAQIGLRIVDILTDFALILLPTIMMFYVQLPWTKRFGVVLMFGLRILTPCFAAVALARLAGFYNASVVDRQYEAVVPSIWTTIALNISIITACLPSIKRFLADWAAGVSNAGISEPIELQYSTGKSRTGYGQSSGLRSFGRSQQGTKNASQNEPEADNTTYSYYARKGRDSKTWDNEDTESRRGLTDDSIVRTVAYTVEYEEDSHNPTTGDDSGYGITKVL